MLPGHASACTMAALEPAEVLLHAHMQSAVQPAAGPKAKAHGTCAWSLQGQEHSLLQSIKCSTHAQLQPAMHTMPKPCAESCCAVFLQGQKRGQLHSHHVLCMPTCSQQCIQDLQAALECCLACAGAATGPAPAERPSSPRRWHQRTSAILHVQGQQRGQLQQSA